jgi:hypothetical protein
MTLREQQDKKPRPHLSASSDVRLRHRMTVSAVENSRSSTDSGRSEKTRSGTTRPPNDLRDSLLAVAASYSGQGPANLLNGTIAALRCLGETLSANVADGLREFGTEVGRWDDRGGADHVGQDVR